MKKKTRLHKLAWPLMCSLGIFASPAFAEDEEDLSSISLEDLLNIEVVSATRSESKLSESPVPMSVITAKEIAASGLDNIPDILARLAEIDVIHTGASQTEVSIRGKGINFNRRLLVLIDGRTEYNDLLGVTFWNAFPITVDDIKRVEVVRGPASALFGANAYSGVINIITKSASDISGAGMVRAHSGSDGRSYASVQAAFQGEKATFKISAGLQDLESDQSHVEFPGFNRIPTTSNFSEDNASLDGIERFNGQFAYQFNERIDLKIGAGSSSGSYELITQPGLPREKWQLDTDYIHLVSNISFGESTSLQINAYQNKFEYGTSLVPSIEDLAEFTNADSRFYFPAVFQQTFFAGDVDTSDVTLQLTGKALDGKMSWVGGIEQREITNEGVDPVTGARCVDADSDSLLHCGLVRNSEKDIDSYFANFTYRFGDSGWHTGLGYRGDDDSITGSDYGYNASLSYFFNTRDNIRFTARRAFRAPTLFEQFSYLDLTVPNKNQRVQFRGNQDARVETIESQDITWTYFISDQMQLTVEVFRETLEDIIGNPDTGLLENVEVDPVTNIFTTTTEFENLADADNKGFQIGMMWLAKDNLTINANYRFADPDGLNSVEGETFFSPEHKLGVNLLWKLNEWVLDGSWLYVAKTDKDEFAEGNVAPDGPNFTRDYQEDYNQVNLTLHYKPESIKALNFYLTMQNALDDDHVEYYEYDEVLKAAGETSRRSVFGGVLWNF